MIGRCAAELDCELHAGPVAELVGVEPSRQADCGSGGDHRAALIGVECAVLTERVDPARVRCGGGEHVGAHEVDVVVGAACELGGNDVCAEERGVVRERRGDVEAALLVVRIEAVAGLDLHRGDPGAPRLAPAACGEEQ